MELPIIKHKSHEQIINSVRKRLELRGASQRRIHCVPNNYDRAIEEINLMQRSFELERQHLVSKLNCTLLESNQKRNDKTQRSKQNSRLKLINLNRAVLKKIERDTVIDRFERSATKIPQTLEKKSELESLLNTSRYAAHGISP